MEKTHSKAVAPNFEQLKNRSIRNGSEMTSGGLPGRGEGGSISRHDLFAGADVLRRSAKIEMSGAIGAGAGARALPGNRTYKVDEQIGLQLQALYQNMLTEPVPDRLLELLSRLDTDKN
jgi:hypothetical protein